MKVFLLSKAQMARLSLHFPLVHGVSRVDDRLIFGGIIRDRLQRNNAPKALPQPDAVRAGISARDSDNMKNTAIETISSWVRSGLQPSVPVICVHYMAEVASAVVG